MFKAVKIAPSILSADFMNMQRDILMLENAGADFIHVDVMDGHFVPNLTVGVPFVKQLKSVTKLPLDVHLMIDNPLEQIPWFLEAGSDWLTVHGEALDEKASEVDQAIDMIRRGGSRVGLAVKPDTPVHVLDPYLHKLDMILTMSVFPGFSGQSYIEGSSLRIAEVVQRCKAKGVAPRIQVDGGINFETAALVGEVGADVLVAGNAVFKAEDPRDAIFAIRESATNAQSKREDSLRG